MLKEKVVKHYGSQRAISAALGVSDSAVSQWGEVIPERIALKLSRITDGALVYDPSFYKVYRASGLTKTTEAEKPCGQQRFPNTGRH